MGVAEEAAEGCRGEEGQRVLMAGTWGSGDEEESCGFMMECRPKRCA